MLHLYLLRHGKAENPESNQNDFDRSLNKKGIVQVNQVAALLKDSKVLIDSVISSSAKRTTETAQIACSLLNLTKIQYFKDLYLADQYHILKTIGSEATGKHVLYVGHNFGISDIAGYLSGENISMSTGMLVEIVFELDNWLDITENSGKIGKVIKPDVFLP